MFPRVTLGVAKTLYSGNAVFTNRAQYRFARAGIIQRYFSTSPALNKQINNNPSDAKKMISDDVKTQAPSVAANVHDTKDKSVDKIIAELVDQGVIWKDGTVAPSTNIYAKGETDSVEVTHREIKTGSDRAAWYVIQFMRKSFDIFSGYSYQNFSGTINEKAVLRRVVFLETCAGVPPMMAGMVRHLQSLRLMKKDGGWIQTLLAEAENERMHLMIALTLQKPGRIFRGTVVLTQFGFCTLYFVTYLIAPKFCHRFVGYLEEEAVKTYTHVLELLDADHLPLFKLLDAPAIAKEYYKLDDGAKLREVLACMRADEAHHRDVNHSLSDVHDAVPKK